mmetsp:Transcript_38687/g.71907  ORF Transcript_38687/g.71907 Transcript_38687/m.71907 type:complete len:243 (-) Transcript_38687:151-879(-)
MSMSRGESSSMPSIGQSPMSPSPLPRLLKVISKVPTVFPFIWSLSFCFFPKKDSALSSMSFFVSRLYDAILESLIVPRDQRLMIPSAAPCGISNFLVCSQRMSWVPEVSVLLQLKLAFTLNSFLPNMPSFWMSCTLCTLIRTSKDSNSSQPHASKHCAMILNLRQSHFRDAHMPLIILYAIPTTAHSAMIFITEPMPSMLGIICTCTLCAMWASDCSTETDDTFVRNGQSPFRRRFGGGPLP